MFIGNISTMPPQGLKPTWLDEAHLKSKNPNNVSCVSCAEHALKWNIKSLSHLSTWKRFTSDWEEFIRKTHHSSPAQEPPLAVHSCRQQSSLRFSRRQVSCPKSKFWPGISSVTQSHCNKIATPPQNPLYCLSRGAHPFSDWHPPPRTKTGHVVWADPFHQAAPNYARPFSSALSSKDQPDNEPMFKAPDNAGHLMWLNIAARAFLFPNQSIEVWGPDCVSQPFAIPWKTKRSLMSVPWILSMRGWGPAISL